MNWLSPVSGSWNDPARWTPAVVPNNGTPPGATYNVTIGAAGWVPFTVTSTGALVLDQLAITNATLFTSTGTLTVGTLSLQNASIGSFAYIRNAHIEGNGTLSFASIDGVSIAGQISALRPTVYGGLTFQDGAKLGASTSLTFAGSPQSISGSGIITSPQILSQSSLTIGSEILIDYAATNFAVPALSGPSIVNQGRIRVGDGNHLGLTGVINSGTIQLGNATVMLTNPASLAAIGRVQRDHPQATVAFNGTFNAAGQPVMLHTADAGRIDLIGATINAATLSSNGEPVRVLAGAGTFGGTTHLGVGTIAADLTVGPGATLGFSSGAYFDHATIRLGSPSYDYGQARRESALYLSNSSGSATVSFERDAYYVNQVIGDVPAAWSVSTGSSGGMITQVGGNALTNAGTISAQTPGKFIAVAGVASFTNNGTIIVSQGGGVVLPAIAVNNGTITGNGGAIAFTGSLTPASLQPFGVVDPLLLIGGTFTPASGTLNVESPHRIGLAARGRLENVTLTGSPNATFPIVRTSMSDAFGLTWNVGTLNNVTANVDLDVTNSNLVASGLVTNRTLHTESASLTATALTNTGTMLLSDTQATVDGAWQNNGRISAINGTTIVANTMPASLGEISLNASTLSLNARAADLTPLTVSTAILDPIERVGSTLVVRSGTWMNDGRTLLSNAATSNVRLEFGTLDGGTLAATAGSAFAVSGGTLHAVTLQGTGTIGPFQSSITGGRLTLDAATVNLQRDVPSGVLRAIGDTIIDGTGELIANHQNFPVAAIQAVNGTLTIGDGITFRTGNAAPFFTGSGTLSSVVNRGEVYCDYPFQAGGTTQLQRFENLGLVEVGPGATFSTGGTSVLGNLNNQTFTGGRWLVQGSLEFGFSNSTISFDTNAADVHLIGPGSQFRPANSLLNNVGTFAISNGRTFTSAGSLSNSGTLIVGTNSTLKTGGALANTGTMDISGELIVNGTSRQSIEQQIVAARNGGAWDQPGVTSSTARDASPQNLMLGVLDGSDYRTLVGPAGTFGGLTFDDSSVLVKLTYYGDTDLNGVVNFDDYSRIDSGFNNNRSGWFNGDFDYNGVVNFDDYALIDLAFNTQGAPLRTQAVPEPVLAAQLSAMAIFSLARRRRVV